MKIRNLILVAGGAILMASCATPKNYNYLQDLQNGQQITTSTDGTIRLQPNDQITVLVRSKDPEMGNLFNKGIITNLKAGLADQSLYMMGYTIGPDGCIDMPSAGKISISGKTRFEAQETIQNKLRDSELLKDANVTVETTNMTYTVMGEVNEPGNYQIEKDVITLFEALGKAGDINVYGKRDSVMVIRQIGKEKRIYNLSLNSGKDIFSSDAYYIQQNDVIYVKANDTKARQSKTPGNESRTLSFWLTLASVLTALGVAIFK
ncbi:polysaccharide export outer membrane protein [Prevotella sp. khp7]|uniref:polysaccharide biosynthesis/export family protein n=1 Tax=Prevotella sp. khp7 TaxID=1761885 RepID=UPI0008B0A120|nr:polysaccharide biosynthesis/export family protein [Prevotella sp. khp7]SEW14140.1 polysaccharide export outer membrane protein [Prevotella sp. khp7]